MLLTLLAFENLPDTSQKPPRRSTYASHPCPYMSLHSSRLMHCPVTSPPPHEQHASRAPTLLLHMLPLTYPEHPAPCESDHPARSMHCTGPFPPRHPQHSDIMSAPKQSYILPMSQCDDTQSTPSTSTHSHRSHWSYKLGYTSVSFEPPPHAQHDDLASTP